MCFPRPDELIVVIDDQFEQALPQQTALRWLPPCKNPVLICLFAATVLPIFMLSSWSAGGRNAGRAGDKRREQNPLLPTAL
jgi:hypothetical protein